MPVQLLVPPRPTDLGGFSVRRLLPHRSCRAVGPFVFFDHMGPADFAPGHGIDVRPHPHIGLATVTWLFDGEILHRDSLGSVQPIRPGALNWMTAGRGIVHSERTGPDTRIRGGRLHGIQAWVALPEADEECEPGFVHYPAEALPQFTRNGVELILIAGTAFGERSPVEVAMPTFYLEARLAAGARLMLEDEHPERAVYVAEGAARVDVRALQAGDLAVLAPGGTGAIEADGPCRLMLLGGAPLDGPRTIWWNFVSSRPQRIEQAKADWRANRFAHVPGESEFIPLPED